MFNPSKGEVDPRLALPGFLGDLMKPMMLSGTFHEQITSVSQLNFTSQFFISLVLELKSSGFAEAHGTD